jgi:hypothetical protein
MKYRRARPSLAARGDLLSSLGIVAAIGCLGCVGDVHEANPGAPGEGTSADPGAPGGGGSASMGALPSATPECSGALPAARIWRLSDQQYRSAVADLLPGVEVPEITTPGRSKAEFINVAELYPVSGALAVDLRSAAKAVAADAVRDLDRRLGCPPGRDQRSCASDFVQALVTRGVRHPLEPAERDAYARLFAFGAERSIADGVRLAIEALLQSPSFLYRQELGTAGRPGEPATLRPFELASALSFFFYDSLPDAELWRAAEDGSLGRPDGYRREVARLLALPRVRRTLGRVFLKWTGLGAGVTTELASEDYPDYDAGLQQALAEEAEHFFAGTLERDGTLADLLTSRRSFVDARLAKLYGVPHPGGPGFSEVTLPADQRSGLLTQAGFVVSKSRGEMVVHRGKWVREELLCGVIPVPPPGVAAEPVAGDLTSRQQADLRVASGTCGTCHRLMDPLGLAFERYDGLARYATRDAAGHDLSGQGEIQESDVDGVIDGAVQLSGKLAASRQARLCIETRMLAYALGRDSGSEAGGSDPAQACEAEQLDRQLAGGGRLLDVMGAIALSPGFRTRTSHGGP